MNKEGLMVPLYSSEDEKAVDNDQESALKDGILVWKITKNERTND